MNDSSDMTDEERRIVVSALFYCARWSPDKERAIVLADVAMRLRDAENITMSFVKKT